MIRENKIWNVIYGVVTRFFGHESYFIFTLILRLHPKSGKGNIRGQNISRACGR